MMEPDTAKIPESVGEVTTTELTAGTGTDKITSDAPLPIMEAMPENILIEIFTHLNRESLVLGARMTCLRWRNLTFDPSLWQFVSVPDHYSDSRLFCLMSQVHEVVEVLEMSNCNFLTDDGLQKLWSTFQFPVLKKVGIPISTVLPDEAYMVIITNSPQLEEIENIRATFSKQCHPLECQSLVQGLKTIHDRPVSTFGRIRSMTTSIDTERREKWSKALTQVAQSCPEVTSYRCQRGMEFLNGEGLNKVSSLFPNLTSLELRNCHIDDDGLVKFFHHNTSGGGLEEVIFDKPGPVRDKGLECIAVNCPKLRNIKIGRCSEITNKGVRYLVERCNNLTDLHINNAKGFFEDPQSYTEKKEDVDDETVAVIAKNCKNMAFFRMFYSSLVTAAGIQNLVSGCKYLHGIMLFECSQVDDNAMEAFSKCRFLRVFIIVNCESVSTKGILNMGLQSSSLNKLTFYTKNRKDFYGDMIDLAEQVYNRIDDNTEGFLPNVIHKLSLRGVGGGFLQLLTVICPNLRTLELKETCFISTHSLASVIKTCDLLQYLDISFMGMANDELLEACAEHGKELRVLSLGSAVQTMSTHALCDVITSCVSLRTISMDISDSDVKVEELVNVAKATHGGLCHLYVDEDDEEGSQPKQHYVELNFTPIKYLGSINTIL